MIEEKNDDVFYYDPQTAVNKNRIVGCRIYHGLKIWCSSSVLKEFQSNPLITKNFKLNILNDDGGYSVYFEDKKMNKYNNSDRIIMTRDFEFIIKITDCDNPQYKRNPCSASKSDIKLVEKRVKAIEPQDWNITITPDGDKTTLL